MTDRNIELIVARLLRVGVITAGTVVAIGGAIYLGRHGAQAADYHVFQKLAPADRTLTSILPAALHGRARSIIQLGILLLIATPVARVTAGLAGFAIERDHKYVVISAIVLSLLLYGWIGG